MRTITSFEELPLVLHVKDLAEALRDKFNLDIYAHPDHFSKFSMIWFLNPDGDRHLLGTPSMV